MFDLGRLSYPIAIAAVLWFAFMSIVFCLPELKPVNTNAQLAPIAAGIILTYALRFWDINTQEWFTGPKRQIAGALALYALFLDWVSGDAKW